MGSKRRRLPMTTNPTGRTAQGEPAQVTIKYETSPVGHSDSPRGFDTSSIRHAYTPRIIAIMDPLSTIATASAILSTALNLMSLSRTGLYMLRDFPFASQHPSASANRMDEGENYFEQLSRRFSSGLKDYRVEAIVGEHQVDALADTGAQSNFISAQFVDKVGLVPDGRGPTKIQLPGGKQIVSPGVVQVPFSFRGELKKHMLECWIIPGCTNDLILSGSFLRATKTLTKFKNRIKKSIRQSLTRLSFNLIGDERQRLWGSLNGKSVLALPDTGSDVMLVSAAWARENKLKIDRDLEHRLELELADGTNVFTTGVVHDARWRFGDSAQEVHSDFYVLEDLSVDVVLSSDFIFEFDVFSEFGQFVVDLDSTPDLAEFFNVKLIGKYSKELARLEIESFNDCKLHIYLPPPIDKRNQNSNIPLAVNSPNARKAERVRRDRIRDAINMLDPSQQNETWEEERRRRLIWDRHYARHEREQRLADAASAKQTPAQGNGAQGPANAKVRWWKKGFLRE